MGAKKQVAINMATQIISFILNIGISFFLASFIVENIGKEMYGFWGLANNFVSYITVFTVALNSMLSRFVMIKIHQNDIETANKYYSSVAIANLTIVLVFTLPTIVFVLFLDNIINIPKLFIFDVKILWLLLFINFFLSLLGSVYNLGTFVKNRLDLAASIDIKSNIFRAILLFVFFSFMPPHLWYIGFITLLCTIYVTVKKIEFMKKLTPQLKIRKKYFNWNSMKELLVVGVWNSINQLSQILMAGMDLLMTNLFIGATDMGYLSIAKTIPLQIQNFIHMSANIFTPQLTKTYAGGNIKEFVKEIIFSMKITGFLGSVPIIGLIIFGKDFFALWMPGLSDNEIVKIQILSVLTLLPLICNTIFNPLFNVNTITAKIKLPVITNLIMGGANIIIVYLLINYTNLGVYAVAAVSGLMILIRMVVFVPIYAAYTLNVKWYTFYVILLRGIVALFILTAMFFVINHIANISSWISFILVCGFAGLSGYIASFIIIFNNHEKKLAIHMIKGKLKKT
ncbi:hypothetical protein COD10_09655 [Bacillus thuringiensis]|uniref:lipopolysaccharide biosynthesis protein n=1 Tax=Bacillus TaxID=1386 RepID=UPI000BECAA37|nr:MULTISPECIES: oligosaccharide flippase family protein [Bacillus]KAA0755516.1 hypothetical protein DN401_15350 [Bacillus sp. BF2-3]MCP1321310.1 oligosaccharide flippase family protein [Bacillus sp. S0628]MCU4732096.1 oligosaccharide flippase family protein [Bacillus cereus]MCU5021754.1 oligosaccharide flippase family protein [Bacillus cereus]MDA2648814.1 oligosaccharide flippase family protein [Bacillus cereus]